MSIRIKLLLLAVIGLCCIGFIGVLSLYSETRMERVMHEQVKIAEALRLNLEADMMHDALRADVLAALLVAHTQAPGGLKAIRDDLEKHARAFQQSLAALDKLGLDAGARQGITAIRPTLERYIGLAHQVATLSEKDPAAALREFELFKQSFAQIETEMSVVSDNIEKATQEVSVQADNQTYWSRMIIVLAAIVGLVVLAGASFTTGRGLLRQLGGEPKAAADAAQEIAQGNLAIKLNTEGQDGSVMASMRQMQVGLVRIVEHIHQVSSQLGLSANGLIGSSAQASEASVKQSSAVEAIAATIEQLSVTVDHLSEHVERVREMAEQSRGLGAEGAAVIGDSIREMREIGSVITNASDEIRHLNEAYAKVSGIVAVIRQVAEQTNLLALNAAIEAARAGDQGRGFAVVADEVRKLAERTAQSTHEIATTVEVMRGQAGKAVAVMGDAVERAHAGMGLSARAEESLQAMNGQSEQVMMAVRDIAIAMREHSSATSDIARNVEAISILSQSGAHSAKGLQQVAQDISGLAKSLEQSVRKFSLRTV